MSKKTPPPIDFYQRVYLLIQQGLYPRQIARSLDISKQRLNYWIRRLKKDGVIEMISPGAWKVSKNLVKKHLEDTQRELSFFTRKEVRGHGFNVRLFLPRLKNWDKRSAFLERNGIIFKPMANGRFQRIFINGHKVWLCDNFLIFYLEKSFFGIDAEDSFSELKLYLNRLFKATSSLLKVRLEDHGRYKWSVDRNHYALIQNEIAKDHKDKQEKLHIFIEGKLVYLVDDSPDCDGVGLLEFEAVAKEAKEDIKPVHKHLIDWRVNPESFTSSEVTNILRVMGNENKLLSENIRSHLSVIQEIRGLIDQLKKERT